MKNGGNDAADGLSDGNAWATVSKVNGFTFNPGDTIYFKRGSLWREKLNLNTARHQGSAGSPVTFSDYGSGSLPRITGFDVQSGFTVAVGARYTASVAIDPGDYCLEDSVPLLRVASTGACEAAAGSFFWAAGILSVHASDGADPDTHTMETVSTREAGSAGNCDYVSLVNLRFDGGNSLMFSVDSSDFITFQSCQFAYSKFILVWLADSPPANNQIYASCYFTGANTGIYLQGTNDTVDSCTFYRVGRSVEMRDVNNAHCQNFLVENSIFSECGRNIFGVATGETNAGVLLDGDTNGDNADHHQGIIRSCTFTDLSGRAIDGFYGESKIIYNTIDTLTGGAAGNAIEDNGPGNLIANNTLYAVENIGIFLNTDPVAPNTASTVENNIVSGATTWHAWSAAARGVTDLWSNNIYYKSGSSPTFNYQGASNTFAQWQGNVGEANSLQTDPGFTDAPNGSFLPVPSSPAVNAGIFIASVSPNQRPDIGAWETAGGFQVYAGTWSSVRVR